MDWESPVEVLREHAKTMREWMEEACGRLAKKEAECADLEKEIRGEKLEIQRLERIVAETEAAIRKIGGEP